MAGGCYPLAYLQKLSPTPNHSPLLSLGKDRGWRCWEPTSFQHICWGEGEEHPAAGDAAREGAADVTANKPLAAQVLLQRVKQPRAARWGITEIIFAWETPRQKKKANMYRKGQEGKAHGIL